MKAPDPPVVPALDPLQALIERWRHIASHRENATSSAMRLCANELETVLALAPGAAPVVGLAHQPEEKDKDDQSRVAPSSPRPSTGSTAADNEARSKR